MIEILDIKDAEPNKSNWIPISDMPNCCGYPVLLTVENKFGQRGVCKAFTNYMKEGKQAFLYKRKGILFRINLKQIKRILETNCLDATSGVL